jgi:integrase
MAASAKVSRLHDARHTAAIIPLLLEVPLRTVMSIMGWSSVEMVARYQHITNAIRLKVAGQVDRRSGRRLSHPAVRSRSGETLSRSSRRSLTSA